MTVPNEVIKSNSIVLILSCLAREPMHGYRIAKEIEKVSEGYFAMGEGTLYPHLHQFEKDSLIEGYWETPSGDRARKMYRITDKGKTELARRTKEWRDYRTKVDQLLGVAPS